ncbi:MAG: hypothetical protein Terrestrivirus1_28 [Terrestrivirus sp.]|uniref:Phosphatidic acid phosphatase type 2/haloperoxidase domain-containing protein n=1 Tax=Terrestrivirus sp. TaxID=2487775 RepID=A0A3G4ZL75_9VIRU|nr:MAG: hypothetical protein Terrestrivirus1_28 [Terrestrivirus sp.]
MPNNVLLNCGRFISIGVLYIFSSCITFYKLTKFRGSDVSSGNTNKNFWFDKKWWHNYVVQCLLLIGLVIYAFEMRSSSVATRPIFFERDPSLSYPQVPEHVPNVMLASIVICVPAGVIILLLCFELCKPKYMTTDDNNNNNNNNNNNSTRFIAFIKLFFWLSIGLAHTLLLAMSIYNTLKITSGRLRPNFYAVCNYAGYNDAYNNNNYTYYNSMTETGALGDYSKCMATDSEIDDASRSFPSGHAALSFASMVYTMYLVRTLIDCDKTQWFSFRSFMSLTVLILSAYISITRVWDYEHHFDDILAGTLIGIFCSIISWSNIEKQIIKIQKKSLNSVSTEVMQV